MRFAFKTAYEHDLGLFRDPVQRRYYAALLAGVILLPLAIPAYLSDMSMVFIYGLCGLSLMVLAGYTGLVSLGHAAFLGIGAYAHVYFTQDLGLPWIVGVALATVAAAASGVLVGLPALRMTGVYLTIATLAFALIIQEVFARWEPVTGGLSRDRHADYNSLRRDRRSAGIAHDRYLSCDRHTCLRCHYPGSVHSLGVRNRRLCRHGRRQADNLRRPLQ